MSGTPSVELGRTLHAIRELQEKSLKAVAEPAGISVAYLAKLEKGDVTSPSPHVLHRLSVQLGIEYVELMRLAGYVVPGPSEHEVGALAHALSSEKLTEDEALAVAAYLKTYRNSQRT